MVGVPPVHVTGWGRPLVQSGLLVAWNATRRSQDGRYEKKRKKQKRGEGPSCQEGTPRVGSVARLGARPDKQ